RSTSGIEIGPVTIARPHWTECRIYREFQSASGAAWTEKLRPRLIEPCFGLAGTGGHPDGQNTRRPGECRRAGKSHLRSQPIEPRVKAGWLFFESPSRSKLLFCA